MSSVLYGLGHQETVVITFFSLACVTFQLKLRVTWVPTLSWSPRSKVCRPMASYEQACWFKIEGLSWVSLLHSAVLQAVGGEAAVGLTAAFCSLVLGQFLPGLPALSQRLHEQGEGGEQIAEPSQVERTVVSLSVVIQEPCKTQTTQELIGLFIHCEYTEPVSFIVA